MGMDHRGAGATQKTMKEAQSERGEIPWAFPFFPPSNRPTVHPSVSTIQSPENMGTWEM